MKFLCFLCVALFTNAAFGKTAVVLNDCNNAAYDATCTGAGATCVDDDATQNNVFFCECNAPDGRKIPNLAPSPDCGALNDCDDAGNIAACAAAGATCEDTDMTQNGDFECVCNATDGRRVPKRAPDPVCGADDCAVSANQLLCTGGNATCEDHDTRFNSNFYCACDAVDGRKIHNGAPNPICGNAGRSDCHANIEALCQAAGAFCEDSDGVENGVFECACDATDGRRTNSSVPDPVCGALPTNDCEIDAYANLCTGGNATCEDHDGTVDGKFFCACAAVDGRKIPNGAPDPMCGGVPRSDCHANNEALCHAAGAFCEDSDGAENGVFECACDAADGRRTIGVAPNPVCGALPTAISVTPTPPTPAPPTPAPPVPSATDVSVDASDAPGSDAAGMVAWWVVVVAVLAVVLVCGGVLFWVMKKKKAESGCPVEEQLVSIVENPRGSQPLERSAEVVEQWEPLESLTSKAPSVGTESVEDAQSPSGGLGITYETRSFNKSSRGPVWGTRQTSALSSLQSFSPTMRPSARVSHNITL
eukprot:TRINITY_DN3646_c0_g1_i1.p1 TRINITY_DN3646_c0_g1~~TRINITY_DN3646_c0_g1_i1.p1  ORF type:complete len:534 (+),score=79.00 TRINITY_DN3646_c0_g1_i1:55-1656(+)